MIYVEHARLKKKYAQSLKDYESIVDEKKQLFEKTQPQGVNVEKERVSGGETVNTFDVYVIAVERAQIDKRLKEAKSISDSILEVLKRKESELRQSKDWFDIIYKLRYVDNLTITQVAVRVPYSRSQVWRKLNEIKKHI